MRQRKNENNILKLMEGSKRASKREVYTDECLLSEKKKDLKQANFTPNGTRKRTH